MSYVVDSFGLKRKSATFAVGTVTFFVGILAALSTNVLGDVKMIGLTFFDLFDKVTSSIFLPLGGFLFAIFYGWVLGPKAVRATVGDKKGAAIPYFVLLWTLRILAPVAVIVMLFNGLKDW